MRPRISIEERLSRQLKVQAVLFWVLSGLSFIFTILFLIWGFAMDSDYFERPIETFFTDDVYTNDSEDIHLGFFIFYLANTVLRFYNGFCLHQKKYRSFSFFVAAYTILAFPVGTVIGIISLVVLSRKGMKGVYEKAEEKRVVEEYMSMKDY